MFRSWPEPFAAGRPYGQLYSSAASAATASSNSFAWLIRSTNVNRTWRRQQQQRSCCGVADSAAAPLQTATAKFLAAKFQRANTAKQASLYTTRHCVRCEANNSLPLCTPAAKNLLPLTRTLHNSYVYHDFGHQSKL